MSKETETPLTDELWLDDEWIQAWNTHTFGSKSECWEYETLWDYLQAKLTSKYGNPTRIVDLERQLAEAQRDLLAREEGDKKGE